MKLKNLVMAALMAVSSASALAEDLNQIVNLVAGANGNFSAPTTATHLLAGPFTDTFNLGVVPFDANINASLNTIGLSAIQDIDFISATLNGIPFSFQRTDLPFGATTIVAAIETGTLPTTLFAAGTPLLLTITGFAGEGFNTNATVAASYSGTVNVVPVPEPGSAMMFIAGFAAIGWLVRRRSR